MFSISTRKNIQGILLRLSEGKEISLKERIYVENFTGNNSTASNWIRQAFRIQKQRNPKNEIDNFLSSIDLDPAHEDRDGKNYLDDIAAWFSSAPSWLARS
tara:strand:- start:895 stop:1197 length:303 start_codon:yes stop_codon:yes gene_type:complete